MCAGAQYAATSPPAWVAGYGPKMTGNDCTGCADFIDIPMSERALPQTAVAYHFAALRLGRADAVLLMSLPALSRAHRFSIDASGRPLSRPLRACR